MTAHSVLYMPSVFRKKTKEAFSEREPLDIPKEMWKTPVSFMLCMALFGLHLYPIILVIIAMLIKAWREDRYNFNIMLFFIFGTFAMYTDQWAIKPYDLGLVTSVGCFLFLKKGRKLKVISLIFFVYAACILILSTFSSETFSTQFYVMRYYFSFISVFIPLAIFANRKFDIKLFFKKFMIYLLIMCIFYIIDGLILKGYIFVPAAVMWSGLESTIFSPYLTPFELTPIRKYPQGLLFIAILIVPIARYYKLKKWQIAVIVIAALTTQTFSYMMALLICIILFLGSRKLIIRSAFIGILAMAAIVAVDYMLPYNFQKGESALRIRSSFEQFAALAEMVDDEDLAKFGTGRMGQALPILELITSEDKRWTGLGFLHPDRTTSVKFIIENEYFTDVTQAERVATGVEIVPVQIFIHIGWCGVILITLFFLSLYLVIRKMRYKSIFMAATLFSFIIGWAGFSSIATYTGMSIISMSYAAVLLANRQEERENEAIPDRKKKSFNNMLLHN